jgi:hypothetical protein
MSNYNGKYPIGHWIQLEYEREVCHAGQSPCTVRELPGQVYVCINDYYAPERPATYVGSRN